MNPKADAIARAVATYNAAADTFDTLSFWQRFGDRTLAHLGLQTGDRVLDVCCGSGASALSAAQQVGPSGSVLAVDVAEGLLQLGRTKATQLGLDNIEFRAGDFETLGLDDASFDAIVCVFGIFFVPDMQGAIQELWRMLRPGGKLAITSWGSQVFEPANQLFWQAIQVERPELYFQFTPWHRISDPAALEALLAAGGATSVQVFAEPGIQPIATPEDWWTIVEGGGCRGTLDRLDAPTRARVKQANLQALSQSGVLELTVEVLYAIAQKPQD